MYLGIDIGGTNIKTGILDEDLKLIDSASSPTITREEAEYTLSGFIQLVRETLDSHTNIKSIGVGIPGIVSEEGTLVVSPNLSGWVNLPIKSQLEHEFELPVKMDNDANTAALAELVLGAGKDIEDFLYITLGTGVGGAIIHRGQIIRGSYGAAGEIGHTIIDIDANHDVAGRFYRLGTLEEYIGRTKIIERARHEAEDFPESELNNLESFDVEEISDLVDRKDPAAVRCFLDIGKKLGAGLSSAMNLLDIRTVIVGGGISLASDLLFDTAEETIRHRAMPHIADSFQLRKAKFLQDAGIIGAALLGKMAGE